MKIDSKLLASAFALALLVTLILKDSFVVLLAFITIITLLGFLVREDFREEKRGLSKELSGLQAQLAELKSKVDSYLISRGGR